MKAMKMSDIIIPKSFAQTHPRKEKIDACKEHWIKTGRQSKYIVVDLENDYIYFWEAIVQKRK